MIEKIDPFVKTEDFNGRGRVFWTVVPAFQAASVVWECPNWPKLFITSVLKPFDEKAVLSIMDFVCGSWDGGMLGESMRVLEGLSEPDRKNMDAVVMLTPPHSQVLRTIDGSLDSDTIVIFPAFRCEFSGDESVELFEFLIRHQLPVMDWNRPCRPQAWIRFDDSQMAKRIMPVGQWRLTTIDQIEEELGHLQSEHGQFSVKNFKGQSLKLRHEIGRFSISADVPVGQFACMQVGEVMNLVLSFLIGKV